MFGNNTASTSNSCPMLFASARLVILNANFYAICLWIFRENQEKSAVLLRTYRSLPAIAALLTSVQCKNSISCFSIRAKPIFTIFHTNGLISHHVHFLVYHADVPLPYICPYNSGVHLRVIGFGYSSRKIRGEWYFFSYFAIWLSVKLIRSSPPSPHIRNGPAKKSVGPYKRFGSITALLPRRNAQLHKQKSRESSVRG